MQFPTYLQDRIWVEQGVYLVGVSMQCPTYLQDRIWVEEGVYVVEEEGGGEAGQEDHQDIHQHPHSRQLYLCKREQIKMNDFFIDLL